LVKKNGRLIVDGSIQTGMPCVQDFKNKYEGERIFIIGNGPSLNQTPLEHLNSEYTLAMNKINKIYTETNWRPSFYYYANSAEHSFSARIDENISLGIPCFINPDNQNIVEKNPNVFPVDNIHLGRIDIWHDADIKDIKMMDMGQLLEFWSNNIHHHVYHYHTIYGASQVAVYMGFDEIYFVGCDLGMEYKNPHIIFESGLDPYLYHNGKMSYIRDAIKNDFFKSLANAIAYKSIQNVNDRNILNSYLNYNSKDHFSSDYFDKIQINNGPKHNLEITKGHIATKRICDMIGVDTYNATVGGELEVYPRVDIQELVG